MAEGALNLGREVAAALQKKQGVVALESTIIAHGMPYPQNVDTARKVEELIRSQGAVPATIAILGGQLVVGADSEQIEYLGKKGEQIPKVNSGEMAIAMAKGLDGATTVASTIVAANLAGIPILATGGIGGVHRGGEKTLDISNDLEQLARLPVMVVCAGVKSILDIGLTLEYLETKGVPVLGYQTKEFPAFYSSESGFSTTWSVESAQEAALVLKTKERLGLAGGALLANPIPQRYALPAALIDAAIEKALQEAEKRMIEGKGVTPFLLAKVSELTAGESLRANQELVYNNARLASEIAVALSK